MIKRSEAGFGAFFCAGETTQEVIEPAAFRLKTVKRPLHGNQGV